MKDSQLIPIKKKKLNNLFPNNKYIANNLFIEGNDNEFQSNIQQKPV